MALYQPTNAIPSSYTKGTVDAVNNKMEISWQVNGNSAMTAFQIDFYLNDANSTPVTSTGKKGTTPEEQKQLGLPFYGTDRFGRPQFFTWNANDTWNNFNSGFTNGNEYKYKITQWYDQNDDVVQITNFASETYPLESGKVYCVPISGKHSGLIYFSVTPDQSGSYLEGAKLYFSFVSGSSWYEKNNEITSMSAGYSPTGTKQDDWIEIQATYEFITNYTSLIQQNSFSVFTTRSAPTLTIYQTDGSYKDGVELPNTIDVSIGYFKALYEPGQSNAIRWIRWQVATANNGVIGEILQDTGDIYTPTLNFEFNGFFNNRQYAIRALGESENGQQTTSGWKFFTISIQNQGQYDGNFIVQCLNKENATLLGWEGVEVIPPKENPQGYKPTITNGSVMILPKGGDTEYSIAWDEQIVYDKDSGENKTIPMNFASPWTAAWKGKCSAIPTNVDTDFIGTINMGGEILSAINDMAFSPDGKLLVVCFNARKPSLYRVERQNITFLKEIDVESRFSGSEFVRFSPNGKILLSGSFNNGVQICSVNGEEIDYIGDLKYNNESIKCFDVQFNSNGNRLIIAGNFVLLLYNVNGTTFSFMKQIYNFAGTENVDAHEHIRLSSDNKILITFGSNLSTENTNTIIYFSVNGDEYTYIDTIKNSIGNSIQKTVNDVSFSPNNKLVAVCGQFDEAIMVFSIVGNEISYKETLTNNGTNFKPTYYTHCVFSPNGKILVFSGDDNTSGATIFTVNNQRISYYDRLSQFCHNIEFSPSSEIVLLLSNTALVIREYSLNYINNPSFVEGKFYELNSKDAYQISAIGDIGYINIFIENDEYKVEIPDKATSVALIVSPSDITSYFYLDNKVLAQSYTLITYTQPSITSVSIYGGDSGVTIDSVSVYNLNEKQFDIKNYDKPDFEPIWNDPNYDLYMAANFNGNLEGGTGTATGSGFRVYRQEVGKNVLMPIATVPSTVTSVKDYGITSRKAYKYSLHAYDNNGAFMSAVENEKVIATCFKNYSLLVCDYDEENDEYHVRKQYLFALNLSTGSVGNNNSPTLNANFTRYPTRMPSTQNHASGTLQGLIGAIYTVPALIEQIGNYKWTAKPSTLDYFDSVDLEQELYDLSTAPYQLFLRDMKGRLRMVATNGAITMTTNIKQKQQSISISFPWVEIGDASDVTIIQTPQDYGWNNDNQVLDVSLDVDVETGELSATYPYPYNGTKFYLTGANKETLAAKTPLGITPAQFNLSEVAEGPNDGELTTTVKVNSENN